MAQIIKCQKVDATARSKASLCPEAGAGVLKKECFNSAFECYFALSESKKHGERVWFMQLEIKQAISLHLVYRLSFFLSIFTPKKV